MTNSPFDPLFQLPATANDEDVIKACAGLTKDDLSAELDKQKGALAASQKSTDENVRNIMDTASGDHQFGNLDPCMGDFYDNEVRAEHRGQAQTNREIEPKLKILQRAIDLL